MQDNRSEILRREQGDFDFHRDPIQFAEVAAKGAPIDSGAMVQVDLTHVSFMDSWGLSAVLAAHADAVERGVGFEVSGASPQVAHLFVITGVAVDYGWPTTFTSDD